MRRPSIHRYLRHGTLPQLRLFEASARLGSFTRATQELDLSQPAAPVQIRKLSDTVEAAPFEQVDKPIYLTDAGRHLQESCQVVCRAFMSLEENLAAMRALESGRLRLAVSTTGMYFAPRLLGAVLATDRLHLAVICVPALKSVFKTEPLDLDELLFCTFAHSLVFFAVEFEKWMVRRGWLYVD